MTEQPTGVEPPSTPGTVEPSEIRDRLATLFEVAGLATLVGAAAAMPTPWRWSAALAVLAAALFAIGYAGLAKR